MTSSKHPSVPTAHIDFACPEDDVVVIRVVGRGSFQNSVALRNIPRLAHETYPDGPDQRRYVVDLKECVTMDSTFFGVLASIGVAQFKANKGRMVLVNANQHVARIMDTLGLTRVMDLREANPVAQRPAQFTPVQVEDPDKLDRIVLMLEAHQQLIELYDSNRARFKNVMECLEASLEAERGRDSSSSAP